MNIFNSKQDFIGSYNEETGIGTLKEVLLETQKIRGRLGNKAYLIDTYLSLFFVSANNNLAYDSAESGFEAGSQLQNLCRTVLTKTDGKKDHPLYEKAVEILNSNQVILEFQECYTQIGLLYLALVDDFFPLVIKEFIKEQKTDMQIVLDDIRIQELYRDISYVVGEEQMERFNLLLKQRFMVSPILSTFIQGFNNDVLYHLITQDIETNKQGFQLAVDNLISN